MLFSLFVGVVAFTLMYVWLVIHRQRAMAMEDALEDRASTTRWRPAGPRRWRRERDVAMEDAGFIIGSYVVTFAVVGALAWLRSCGAGRRSWRQRTARRRRQVLDLSARSMTDLIDLVPAADAGAPAADVAAGAGSRSWCSCSCSSPAA